MSKQVFILAHPVARQNAIKAIEAAPENYRVEIRQRTRSLDQNARMWAMLGELARQVEWHGQHLTAENWKDICTAALKRQDVVPGIDGGFVVLGTSTRNMTVGAMSELIEFITAFGTDRGVVFNDMPREVAA